MDELVKKIRDEQIERQRNKVYESFSIHIFQSTTNQPMNNSFIYTHVLIHCLIETNSSLTDKTDLLSLCKKQYAENEVELKIIEEFEQNYFPSHALWWYTRQSFLYRILKKALQIQDIEILLLFRFFIRDIERQLEKTKCTSPINVYYGQIMSNDELKILNDNIGNCMIINSFLSTTGKKQIRTYFSRIQLSNDLQCVLFAIDADPQLENIKPFSNITSQSYYSNEQQTLFMLGSIFRINNIQQEQDGMWTVRLTLCSENEPEIKSIFDQKQMTDQLSFGRIFGDLRRFDTAEIYYQHLLKDLPSEHEDMISCYDALGDLEKQKGDYNSSLEYFNQALEIRMKIFETDDQDIGDGYINIGEIYRKKKDFNRALDSFNKAKIIYSKKLNNDHPKIAICFNNMGHVYMDDRKYSEALECYEKTLSIRKKCFPDSHVQLAESYRNIGNAHENLKDFDQALDSYNRSIQIYEKSSIPPHFTVGIILKNIGSIYEGKKQYQQAHSYYQKALASFQNVLSETDNRIIQIQQDIRRVSVKSK